MAALDSLLTRISAIMEYAVKKLVIVLIVALVTVITLQILMREFATALSWSDEISRFLLVYLSMFGSALAYNQGSHISIRLFHDKLPEPAAKAVDIVINVLSLIFFVLFIQYSIVLITRQRFQVSGAVQMPMQYIYAALPVSAAAMCVFCLNKIVKNLRFLLGGRAAQ